LLNQWHIFSFKHKEGVFGGLGQEEAFGGFRTVGNFILILKQSIFIIKALEHNKGKEMAERAGTPLLFLPHCFCRMFFSIYFLLILAFFRMSKTLLISSGIASQL